MLNVINSSESDAWVGKSRKDLGVNPTGTRTQYREWRNQHTAEAIHGLANCNVHVEKENTFKLLRLNAFQLHSTCCSDHISLRDLKYLPTLRQSLLDFLDLSRIRGIVAREKAGFYVLKSLIISSNAIWNGFLAPDVLQHIAISNSCCLPASRSNSILLPARKGLEEFLSFHSGDITKVWPTVCTLIKYWPNTGGFDVSLPCRGSSLSSINFLPAGQNSSLTRNFNERWDEPRLLFLISLPW
jgi:hypothetical protein